jgi:hypothetical protein
MILFIGMFTLGSSSFIDFPWQGFIDAGNFTDYPIGSLTIDVLCRWYSFLFLTVLGFQTIGTKYEIHRQYC